ncbi:response regulator transcription factor [Paenibacillus sp. IITD108]|uniref:response regulator transcription factor n=1 Tax=Paenibacillus sp. IITD108 TaxID=3116649 RepID=UPI002F403CD4
MYKVMLVDDERQIRQGLMAKINWEQHGFTICGEAADGKEALDKIAALRPHLVITDIRMPVMDGAELLKQCAALYPDCYYIVLSGYEEFSYVKAAMKYGASDYLLKPVIRKELASLLQRIKEELDAKQAELAKGEKLKHELNQHTERLREQFWLQAVRSGSSAAAWVSEGERLGLSELLHAEAWVCFAAVEIGDARCKQHPSSVSQQAQGAPDPLLLLAAYLTAAELLEQWHDKAYVFRDSAMPQLLHLVFKTEPYETAALQSWLENEFRIQLEGMLTITLKIGIGIAVQGPEQWKKGFTSSRLQWMQFAQQTPSAGKGASAELPPQTEKQLSEAIEEGNRSKAALLIQQLTSLSSLPTLQEQSVRMLRLLLLLDSLAHKHGIKLEEAEFMLGGLPESLWQCVSQGEAGTFFTEIMETILSDLAKNQQNNGQDVIQQAAAYLHEHYADETISLTHLADRFHLHTTYLSELFKKTIGKNYRDYLTEIRIEKAKQLLEREDIRVTDISGLTGFSNPNYFSQVFKKVTGFSPLEYQQNRKK